MPRAKARFEKTFATVEAPGQCSVIANMIGNDFDDTGEFDASVLEEGQALTRYEVTVIVREIGDA